jgi:uncharacterized protein
MAVQISTPVKNNAKVLPDWRTICQQRALKQATVEARKAWKLKSAKAIPFNHRWEHVQSVVSMALWLARQTEADLEIVEAAAWLHDVRKGEPSHGAAGAREARKILEETDFPPAKIDAVTTAIGLHAGLYRPADSAPIEPLEAAVLWDADKLTKIGVQALAYNLSMSYMRGLNLAQRRRNMMEFTHSVLGRTVTSMNTAPARRIAEQRYRTMLAVLTTWEQEEEEVG